MPPNNFPAFFTLDVNQPLVSVGSKLTLKAGSDSTIHLTTPIN